jgi:hypothetical protein
MIILNQDPSGHRREVFKILNDRARNLVDEGDEKEAPSRLNTASLFDELRQKRDRRNSHLSPN